MHLARHTWVELGLNLVVRRAMGWRAAVAGHA